MKTPLTLLLVTLAGGGAGIATLVTRLAQTTPANPAPPASYPDRQVEWLRGPFPGNAKVSILEVSQEGDDTFIRLSSQMPGTFHMSEEPRYVVRSGMRTYRLKSVNGGYRAIRVVAGGSVLLQFEKFPLDAPFDLLEGGEAQLSNANNWHLMDVRLGGNARETRTFTQGLVNVPGSDPRVKLTLVRYQESQSGVGLTLNFPEGQAFGPGSEFSYYVLQDGKTFRMVDIDGPNCQEITNPKHPAFGKSQFVYAPPLVRCWFEPFDVNRPFDLIEGKYGKEWNLKGVNLAVAKAAFAAYRAQARKAFDAIATKNDCDAWLREFALNDPDKLAQAIPAKREEAFRREVQTTGLVTRFGYKQGRIGERWVPSVGYSTSSSDTVYVNNQPVTTTTTGRGTNSGFEEKIEGYTAIYGLKNSSANAYIVELTATGTSTYNPLQADKGAWGDEKGTRSRTTQTNAIRVVKRVLVKGGGDFKDQLVVGEAQPSDFKIEVTDFWKVEPAWVAKFEQAMMGECHTRAQGLALRPLLTDLYYNQAVNHENGWKKYLVERFNTVNTVIREANLRDIRQDVEITLSPASDYDPDFFNDVPVRLKNKSAYKYDLTLKKPDGGEEKVTLEPHGTANLVWKLQRVSRADLKVEITAAVAPPERVFTDAPEPKGKPAPPKKPAAKKK